MVSNLWSVDALRLFLLSLHLLHLEFCLAISVVLREIAILAKSFRIMQFLGVLAQPRLLLLGPLLARSYASLVEAGDAQAVGVAAPVTVSTLVRLVFKAILQLQDDLRVSQVVELFKRFAVIFLFLVLVLTEAYDS